jgi:flagella basal body P-ring formation protein FlgA
MAGGDLVRVAGATRSEAAAMVLLAGAKVTLIQRDEAVRIEMQGVAQGSGAVGDRVRVRLLALTADGSERFVDGIVRGSDVVEVVTR